MAVGGQGVFRSHERASSKQASTAIFLFFPDPKIRSIVIFRAPFCTRLRAEVRFVGCVWIAVKMAVGGQQAHRPSKVAIRSTQRVFWSQVLSYCETVFVRTFCVRIDLIVATARVNNLNQVDKTSYIMSSPVVRVATHFWSAWNSPMAWVSGRRRRRCGPPTPHCKFCCPEVHRPYHSRLHYRCTVPSSASISLHNLRDIVVTSSVTLEPDG